jgi:hypothetical protein
MVDACGTTSANGGPSICAVPIYPREVTASLRREMKAINLNDAQRRKIALERLQLPDTMTLTSNGYKTMKDAAMIELQFSEHNKDNENDSKLVHEVDVVRGREMVKHNTGDVGSICMVVRRPG